MEMEMMNPQLILKTGDLVRLIADHSYTVLDAGRYDYDDDDAPYREQHVRLDAGSVIVVDHVGDDVYGDHNGQRVHLTNARFEVVKPATNAG